MSRIAIIGSGSWGTALALSLERRGGHSVTLWSHSPEVAEIIERHRENRAYLPGISIPAAILSTPDLHEALRDSEIIVSAVPSEHVAETCAAMLPWVRPEHVIVTATKGLIEDQGSGMHLRVSEAMQRVFRSKCLQSAVGALSGPSFAREVAAGSPTAITIAFAAQERASFIQQEFSGPTLRLYTNDDVIGVELGGALKNVIAIAAGVACGLELGHNSMAAIITRGVAEITRLAVACGGRRETLAGLSGLGDLVLTCTGPLSRNRTVGIELGRGRALPDIITGLQGKVAEGVRTTSAALGLAQQVGVEMPITAQMAEILHQGRSPRDAIRELMARPGRDE